MKSKILSKWMRRSLCFFVLTLVFAGFAFSQAVETGEPAKKTFKIGLAVFKDNPDYYTARTAFVNVLERQKDIPIELKVLDAYGDAEVYKKGLENFVNTNKVDLIFTTGTRSTQPAVEIVKDIPVVFTAVADPVGAGIVKSLESSGNNVTGTHCAVPADAQVKTILKVLPAAKKIGIVYTQGEANAEIQVQDFKKAAEELGLEVMMSTVSKHCKTEEEVAEAAKKLAGKVDVLAGFQDTSISQYGGGMFRVAEENKIPTYVSLGQLLSRGAVFSLSIDFGAIGSIAGEQALRILRDNVRPADIFVDTERNYSLLINLTAAKKIELTIPIQVLRSASKIIK